MLEHFRQGSNEPPNRESGSFINKLVVKMTLLFDVKVGSSADKVSEHSSFLRYPTYGRDISHSSGNTLNPVVGTSQWQVADVQNVHRRGFK